MHRIDAFLELAREQGCSDIHFAVGQPPLVRLDGQLVPLKIERATVSTLYGQLALAGVDT